MDMNLPWPSLVPGRKLVPGQDLYLRLHHRRDQGLFAYQRRRGLFGSDRFHGRRQRRRNCGGGGRIRFPKGAWLAPPSTGHTESERLIARKRKNKNAWRYLGFQGISSFFKMRYFFGIDESNTWVRMNTSTEIMKKRKMTRCVSTHKWA